VEYTCARVRRATGVVSLSLSLSLSPSPSLCGARNEGLSPHKADLYKALLKCTVNTEIIHPRRAIRDASARYTLARPCEDDLRHGGRSAGTRAIRAENVYDPGARKNGH